MLRRLLHDCSTGLFILLWLKGRMWWVGLQQLLSTFTGLEPVRGYDGGELLSLPGEAASLTDTTGLLCLCACI